MAQDPELEIPREEQEVAEYDEHLVQGPGNVN